MRKVTVLLAVVVMAAMVAPAYGQYFVSATGDWSWDNGMTGDDYRTNWNTDPAATQATVGGWVIPGTGDYARIRNDGTVTIDANVDLGGGRVEAGYYPGNTPPGGGIGHVLITDPNVSYTSTAIYLGLWNWWHTGNTTTPPCQDIAPPSFTQRDGTVTCEGLYMSRSDGGEGYGPDAVYPNDNGYGKYTISGGTLNETYNGIHVGWALGDPSVNSIGKGIFRIEGDAATINSCQIVMNQISRMEVQLNATSGGLSPVNVTPKVAHPAEKVSDLRGELNLDANGYASAIGDRVNILVLNDEFCAGTWTLEECLDYSLLTLTGDSTLDRTINGAITHGFRLTTETGDDGLGNDTLSLQALYTTLGDASLDGSVTGADYTLYAANYNAANATWEMGDFNGDGAVTGADYTLYAANYGTTPPPSAVPEPMTMTLLAVGGLGALIRRRK